MAKIYKEGDKTNVKCPNCGCRMRLTGMHYWYHYEHGYGDGAYCSTEKWTDNGLKCGRCKMKCIRNYQIVDFKGFELNHWDKEHTIKQWIEDVKAGKGKNVIRYS